MKVTNSLELLARNGQKRLFTAHWAPDNVNWMKYLNSTDFCVFSDVSFPGPGERIVKLLEGFEYPDNLYFLCNDPNVYMDRLSAGLPNVHYVNQNAFIDDQVFQIDPTSDKKYDAIYNARLRPVKRHVLAKGVGESFDLALIVGFHTPGLGSVSEDDIPKTAMRNEYQLLPTSVCRLLNEARTGLILSDAEGACFASSEYLLCGLPVVSTKSQGGRDFWYDDYNSIIADDNEHSVEAAVRELLNEPRDPYKIRESHISKMFAQRQKFVDRVLLDVFSELKNTLSINSFFDSVDYRRFMVFQNKKAWKKIDEIQESFENDTFEAGFDFLSGSSS